VAVEIAGKRKILSLSSRTVADTQGGGDPGTRALQRSVEQRFRDVLESFDCSN